MYLPVFDKMFEYIYLELRLLKFNILQLKDIYSFEVATFMYKYSSRLHITIISSSLVMGILVSYERNF